MTACEHSHGTSVRGGGAFHIDAVTMHRIGNHLAGSRDGHFRVSVHRQQGYGSDLLLLERQLLLMLIGAACAVLLLCIRTELLEKVSVGPARRGDNNAGAGIHSGLGHMVNGSRRWLQVAGLNFQASELARVLVLIYLASYAVRREEALRTTFGRSGQALGSVGFRRGAAAGRAGFRRGNRVVRNRLWNPVHCRASLRYVIAMTVIAGAGFAVVAVSSSYRMRRLTTFLKSLGRSLQQRIPADPVPDRHRPRPVVRGGPGRERP